MTDTKIIQSIIELLCLLADADRLACEKANGPIYDLVSPIVMSPQHECLCRNCKITRLTNRLKSVSWSVGLRKEEKK